MNLVFLHRFDKPNQSGPIDVLVAFLSADGFDEEPFLDVVVREIDTNLRPDELIIITRRSAFERVKSAFENSVGMTNFLDRLGNRAHVTLIAYGIVGEEVGRAEILAGGRSSDVGLAELSRRGATSIFRNRGGFIESTPSYHFENPSKRHTDRFMRLSNILVRQAEIGFIAFSLLHLLPADARIAYIDTPALYAVIAALNDQLHTLDATRPTIVADNFGSYQGHGGMSFTGLDEAVAIISASSSGGLAKNLSSRGFESHRILHLLYLGANSGGHQVAIDLAVDPEINPLGYDDHRAVYELQQCRLCAEGSIAIPLRGDQFDIAGPQPEPLVVRRDDAPPGLRAIMQRFVGTKAFMVGAGTAGAARRQFTVDPLRLIASEAFLKQLRYAVHRHVPAGVTHAVAVDEPSKNLVDELARAAGLQIETIPRDRIDDLKSTFRPEEGRALLVVSAVTESGRSLLDISRDLRNVCSENPLIYVVGFAKLAGEEARKALERNLVQTTLPIPHSLVVVDEMILPTGVGANAWVDELNLWNDPATLNVMDEANAAWIARRIDRLNKTSEPLVDDLFLANVEAHRLQLQLGFVFWPEKLPTDLNKTEADVFFTIASVLQRLRSNSDSGSRAIRANWFQQTLLAPANFARFNDGIIQASLLRAARPAEIDYANAPETSAEAARIVGRVIASSNQPRGDAAMEFLVAIACRRLRFCHSDLATLLVLRADTPPMISDMIKLCRQKFLLK
jgi:hypothetical protein